MIRVAFRVFLCVDLRRDRGALVDRGDLQISGRPREVEMVQSPGHIPISVNHAPFNISLLPNIKRENKTLV
jgi:hypothetical protein